VIEPASELRLADVLNRDVGGLRYAGAPASGELYQAAFHHAPCGVILIQRSGDRIAVSTNPALLELLDLDEAELRRLPFGQLLHPDDREMAARLAADLDAGDTTVAGDLRVLTGGGDTRWVRMMGTRFRTEDQDAYLLNVTDISERKRFEAELTEKALHDPLTGLPNRRFLAERLGESLSRTTREGSTMAVLYLDLDRFKRINDQAGHAIGDRALITIAERLRHILRPTDTLARIGGDEFVVVCDGLSTAEDGLEVVRRAREAIAEPVQLDGDTFEVTVSIGVAFVVGREASQWSADRLVAAADDAMYASKDVRAPATGPGSAVDEQALEGV
jgi:diguanylate cyclase (GGDEF)-like protein/PAS domain S-box-containing protein